MENTNTYANRSNNIPGWGVDADEKNDPTYPMKHRTGADHLGMNYERVVQQPVDVEILHSIERPGVSRVFGTSAPPSGMSGKIRRHAFKYSEATAKHWMMLVLADRVNVVEGIVDDLRRGHLPNFVQEFGWRAEWQHNRKKFIGKMAARIAAIAAAVWVLRARRSD
jgi:hypothetical protein